MWETRNTTPFAAQGYLERDPAGREHWVGAVRASFDLAAGALPRVTPEQPPVRLAQCFDDSGQELIEESDFAPFRPEADIVLRGTAHPPGPRQTGAFSFGFLIGRIRREMVCHGPRRMARRGTALAVETLGPAVATPISWRETFGGRERFPRTGEPEGPDALNRDNPVGRGWSVDPAGRIPQGGALDLPPIEVAGDTVVPGAPLPAPAGCGAIAPHWAVRLPLAGRFDARWEAERHPLMPEDFDARFFHAAPAAQRAPLVGGEPMRLVNLVPGGVPVDFRLPQLLIDAQTRIGRDLVETRMRLVAVIVDADRARLTMVYNTAVPCPGRDAEVAYSRVRLRQASGMVRA
ncbi:DUF2169 family type VI secretion system accessory protein [Acidimangrovimonas sediminis]|uniref:DUF2169 family type VI secretion system accessory protein n=1 Tax=Acidimangrovimonas sediminis TaxID=2056283 RepID=UPI000C7FE3A3|nr:DUF2169 domain-containing protein [Acidimangrovimonas sediminis]